MSHTPSQSSLLANLFGIGGHSFSNAFLRFPHLSLPPVLSTIKSIRDIDEDTSKIAFESYMATEGIHTNNADVNSITTTTTTILENLPNIHHPIITKPVLYDVSPSGNITFTGYHNGENKPIIEISSSSYNYKIDA